MTDKQIAELFSTVEWETAGTDTQYQIIETSEETIPEITG